MILCVNKASHCQQSRDTIISAWAAILCATASSRDETHALHKAQYLPGPTFLTILSQNLNDLNTLLARDKDLRIHNKPGLIVFENILSGGLSLFSCLFSAS